MRLYSVQTERDYYHEITDEETALQLYTAGGENAELSVCDTSTGEEETLLATRIDGLEINVKILIDNE